MHPYVHAFNAAISPPWQARSDYDTFQRMAAVFSEIAGPRLGTVRDVVAVPLQHDTPTEASQPLGKVLDWRAGECEPVPGRTMPNLVVVERDYGAIAAKMGSLGPNVENLGTVVKGITLKQGDTVEHLARVNGVVQSGVAAGRPSLVTAEQACETILALSGVSNGSVAVAGFEALERRTGQQLADLARDHEGKIITFAETQSRPQPVITSWEWSGSEHGGRRYSPFTINVERLKPWHTLTGRQHFFLDHEWMAEVGEWFPTYRPPLNLHAISGYPRLGEHDDTQVVVRYLTPHSKWSIHSEYQDNLFMLALSRGGPDIWMSTEDAAKIGVKDNDWIEAVNRNGVVVARAVVSHRMPEGTVYMYHAKDRTVGVPRVEATGKRGGIHNSLTRLLLKPTHLIGGYAQLSYGFNYYGPTGNQRDEVTTIRRRSQEVEY
jgi:nitrate reductase alpha subunit